MYAAEASPVAVFTVTDIRAIVGVLGHVGPSTFDRIEKTRSGK